MALKIRFRQQGRNNRPFYRLVVTDARSPRDGKYIEMLGWYNPIEPSEEERGYHFEVARIQHWLDMGAVISDNAHSLLGKAVPGIFARLDEKKIAKRVKNAVAKRSYRKRVKEKAAAAS